MTTLKLYASPTGELLSVGEQWCLRVATKDSNGYLSSVVSPTVTITLPNSSTTSPVFVDQGSGVWLAVYTVASAGRYVAHIATAEDASDTAVYVYASTTASGMPVVGDVAVYLRESASSFSTEDMQAELDSEASAQRAKCGERAVYPPDLRRALLRRVQRALAMRTLPLALPQGDAESNPAIVPGRDPEVRRLEGPYLKRRMG